MKKEITLPSNLDKENIHEFIKQIDFEKKYDILIFNLEELNFIRPIGLATLTAFILLAKKTNLFAKGKIITPKNKDVELYLNRMDFYNILEVERIEFFRRHNSKGRFKEIIEITSEDNCRKVSEDVCNILKRNIALSLEALKILNYSISEIGENIFHHAESPINGLICAQSYLAENKVEISIVDCGIGIKKSLQKNPNLKIRNTKEALALAIESRITSVPDRARGEGLFFVSKIVQNNNGIFTIYSGDAILKADNKGIQVNDAPFWKGTIIDLDFTLEIKMKLKDIFNLFAPPEDDYELQIDKDNKAKEIPFDK